MGLGSNLGHKEENIVEAVRMIEEQIGPVMAQSALFYSEPWGFESQNSFVNAVVRVSTTLRPFQLLQATQHIEHLLGKTQQHATNRNGQCSTVNVQCPVYHDRPIDIDILLYDHLSINKPRLAVPHPLMKQRPFVMVPLLEVITDDDKAFLEQ